MLFGILLFSCEKDDDTFIPNDELKVETRAPKNKVELCHTTGNGSWHVISVNQNAVAAHVAHGDIILDEDGDGFVKQSPCAVFDCDDTDPDINPSAEEVNDGVDNDCDGVVDDGAVLTTYYKDNDEDGYGDAENTVQNYSPPEGFIEIAGDCNDNDAEINPAAQEVIDGIDNNCDGIIDVGIQFTFYLDNDMDGFGDPNNSVQAYIAPPGYVEDNTDCDDAEAAINPVEAEICDDGIDNDCDELVDNQDSEDCVGQLTTYYFDYDQDGYGDPNISIISELQPYGYVDNNEDCNDADASINPAAEEVGDGIDNNCDGVITNTYFIDNDGDGYGDLYSDPVIDVTQPVGYVDNNEDCRDHDPAINPAAEETCNGNDNNCDGIDGCDDPIVCGCSPECSGLGGLLLSEWCDLPFPEDLFTDPRGIFFTNVYGYDNGAYTGYEEIRLNRALCLEGYTFVFREAHDDHLPTWITYIDPNGVETEIGRKNFSTSSCIQSLYTLATAWEIYSDGP